MYNIYLLQKAADEALDTTREQIAHYRARPRRGRNTYEGYTEYTLALDSWRQWNDTYTGREVLAWKKLQEMCLLVGADISIVVAVEKAIRRNARKHRRGKDEALLNYRQRKSYRIIVKQTEKLPF